MTRIEHLKTARLIRALITTRLRTKPKRPLSMGKASSFPFPYSSLLVSSKITHLTKLYIGMYRIYSIKLAITSNKRPSLWEENLISAHPNPRPPRFCNLLDITSNYHSHTPLQHCSIVKVGFDQTTSLEPYSTSIIKGVSLVLQNQYPRKSFLI